MDITAQVEFTWDYQIKGFHFATYEVIATVGVVNNRPVITALAMEGAKAYPSNARLTQELPDTLKGLAFDDLSHNNDFLDKAREKLTDKGFVFEDENSFKALFVKPYSEMHGIHTGSAAE